MSNLNYLTTTLTTSAAIRRYMIEYGILERDGGSVYWVVSDNS